MVDLCMFAFSGKEGKISNLWIIYCSGGTLSKICSIVVIIINELIVHFFNQTVQKIVHGFILIDDKYYGKND